MTRRLRRLFGFLVVILLASGVVWFAADARPENECRRCDTSAHTVDGVVGCVILPGAPRWRCTKCGETWGHWHPSEQKWWEFWTRF